jgi:ParB family chromosome partitioning protein
MAKIKEFREIPLEDLEVGMSQARTRQVSHGIAELADSIRKQGLLEPIVVCPGSQAGKYEILTGQRRFLAHVELGLPTIWAAVLDSKVDEVVAKVISVTENLVRHDLNRQDLIDACTYLFYKYGTARAVADETGLPYPEVCNYVKFDRLTAELQELVRGGQVELSTALRAQTAAEQMGGDVASSAVVIAKEMGQMTNVQQRTLQGALEEASGRPIEEVIEEAKVGAQVTQIVVTLGQEMHRRLQQFADDEGTTQDDAALSLIEEGLSAKGYVS